MNNKGVAIKYGDIAPEAKENFIPSTDDKTNFVDLSQLQKYNLIFPNYANPCELYSVALDGKTSVFPSKPENKNLGLWSEQLSDIDGSFATPIMLNLRSDGQYSSQGITFTFDTDNQIYPSEIHIYWYRNGELLDEDYFYPDNAFYFCRKKIENYNQLVIFFTSLNMPRNRLKLRSIDYGYGTYFNGEELRSVKLIQEINPISSEIAINTADFVLDSKSDMEYSFQEKQPLNVYFNGELKATTFVKSSKRKSKALWEIQTEDYIGLMDGIQYCGGIYNNALAVDILTDIFTTAKVPFSIDETFSSARVTGYIPYTTCREALMQVAFAIQAVVDTSNSEVVKVYELDEDIKQTIPLDRIMQGQNFADEETVTSVEVSVHSYKPITETLDVYSSEDSGTGENIFIKFSEPLHDLTITNGQIIESGTNYAVINANSNCTLIGQKYEHTTITRTKNNPIVLAGEVVKVVAVANATLVSASNISNVLEKCYTWLIRTTSTNLKIVEGKHIINEEIVYDKPVNVGQNISAETEYLGIVSGRLIKQSFSLCGGIIIKEAVLK